jgi:hypothetical protein
MPAAEEPTSPSVSKLTMSHKIMTRFVGVTLKHYLALLKAMQREADAAQLEQRLLAMQMGNPTQSPSTP